MSDKSLDADMTQEGDVSPQEDGSLARRVLSDPQGLKEYEKILAAFAATGALGPQQMAYLAQIQAKWDLDESECEGLLQRHQIGQHRPAVTEQESVEARKGVDAVRPPAVPDEGLCEVRKPLQPFKEWLQERRGRMDGASPPSELQSPRLADRGMMRRLGRGPVIGLSKTRSGYLVLCAGGAVELDEDGGIVLEIDALVKYGAVNFAGTVLALITRANTAQRDWLEVWRLDEKRATLHATRTMVPLRGVLVSPDGLCVAVTHVGGIDVLDSSDRDLRVCFTLKDVASRLLTFAVDGRLLVAQCGSALKFWDAANGWELTSHPLNSRLFTGASPDGRFIASAGDDYRLVLWDLSGEVSLSPAVIDNSEVVAQPVINAEYGLFAYSGNPFSGKRDMTTVSRIDGHAFRSVTEFKEAERSTYGTCYRSFSSDCTQLAVTSKLGLMTWYELPKGAVTRQQSFGTLEALQVVWAPDSRHVICQHGDTIRIWDIGTGQETFTTSDRGRGTELLMIHPLDNSVFQAFNDGRIEVLNCLPMSRGKQSTIQLQPGLTALCFSPEGRYLITGSNQGALTLKDLEGRDIASLESLRGAVDSLVVSRDGSVLVAVQEDGSVMLCEPRNAWAPVWTSPRLPEASRVETGRFRHTAHLSADGQVLAVASLFRMGIYLSHFRLRWWNVSNRACPVEMAASIDRLYDIGASGRVVGAASDGGFLYSLPDSTQSLQAADIETAARDRRTRRSGPSNAAAINRASLSPDEKAVAVIHDDGTLRIWQVDPVEIQPLEFWPV